MSRTLLAIDTATEAFSVALCHGGQSREVFALAPREHAARLLPTVQELLSEAGLRVGDLDAIVVTRGPGSFTGVRIGIAAAQGLALGADLGLIPVSTLHSLALYAHQSSGCQRVVALLDARMNQVYTGQFVFEQPSGVLAQAEKVCDPAAVSVAQGQWLLAGPGVSAYGPQLRQALGTSVEQELSQCYPHASTALTIAMEQDLQAVAAEFIEPAYLRAAVR